MKHIMKSHILIIMFCYFLKLKIEKKEKKTFGLHLRNLSCSCIQIIFVLVQIDASDPLVNAQWQKGLVFYMKCSAILLK